KGMHPMCPYLAISIFRASTAGGQPTPREILVQHTRKLLLSFGMDAGRRTHAMLVAPAIGLATTLTLVKGARWLLQLVVARQLARWERDDCTALKRQLHRLLRHIDARDTACAAGRHLDLADAGQLLLGCNVVLVFICQAAHKPPADARDLGRVER